MNGSHPDYVELSDSTYEKLPENTQGTITGVSQNSNECDNPGNSDRVQKSNILEKGDSSLSNHYGPSVTTKQLNTSYVFVGSVQETSREVKLPPTPSSGLTDDTSQYSLATKDYKPRSKSIESMKSPMKETNNNVNMKNDFTTQRSPAYTSSEYSSNSGQCRNATNGECVKDCTFMCRGDYQSCETCKGYVSCEYGYLSKRICINPRLNITLFWDDKLKGCEFESSTCYYK
uniref:Uncharacterized protein n=1 Tax=Magallana gigas TaxID=29159 RepID=A0A8W8NI06_MAGGI